MKPLCRLRNLAVLAVLPLAISCDGTSEVVGPLQPVEGSANAQGTSPGNSAKSGRIAARILIDGAGNAMIEVRTGTFDDATGVGVPDGWFEKVHYKVHDASGKLILTRNVSFSPKTAPSSFFSESIPVAFDPSYTVTVQANLRGVAGDGKRTDVVRGTAVLAFARAFDLQPLTAVQVGFGADVQNPGFFAASPDVKAGSATAFQVLFNNTGPAGSSNLAAMATCSVQIFEVNADGSTGAPVAATTIPYQWYTLSALQDATPTGTTWSASTPILIPANAVAGCRFILSLAGVGTTKRVVVTINSLTPGEHDSANNSVTTDFNVVAFTPATPPAEGQVLGQAFEITTYDGPDPTQPGNFVGIVKQQLDITGLSALVVDGAINEGTFTLRMKMGTAPALANGNINLAAVTAMADAEWTGTVAALVAAKGGCLASNNSGTLTTHLAVNAGIPTNTICVDEVEGGLLRLRVLFNWTTTSVGVPGGVPLDKFASLNVGLTFSSYSDQLGANASMKLTDPAFGSVQNYGSPGYTFGVCPPGPDLCPRTIKPFVEAVRVQSP